MQNPIQRYKIDKAILFYIFFGILLLALCVYIKDIWHGVMSLVNVFEPVLFGLVFAIVLNVLMRFLERRIFDKVAAKFPKFAGAERVVSIVVTLLIIAGFVALFFVIVLPQFITSISLLASRFPKYVEHFIEWADSILRFYHLDALLLTEFANYASQLLKSFTNLLTNAVPDILGFTASFAGGLINVIFGLIFAVYMLAGKEKLTKNINRFMDCFLPQWFNCRARYVVRTSDETFSRFLEGQCLDALCLGCLSFVVFSIMDMPYTLVIAVTLALTNIIPVVGPWLGSIPCAVITFVISPFKALILVITIIILQEVENKLIYPRIVGGRVGLDGIWVLVGVLCGGKLAGLVGILLGVPIVAVLGRLLGDKISRSEAEGEAAAEEAAE